jgi:hypothetical protein
MVKIPYAWYTVVGFAIAYKEVPAVLSFHPLTFKSLAVSLRTTRFNIQNFYMVLALR